MIFAITMDYTVFLLSSAKEHWDRSGDPSDAMVGGLAHSGRVIFAAGAVMVAVFFTFALSGPLPPKEMGIILGVAVLLDALLVRLMLVPVAVAAHRQAGLVAAAAGSTGSCPTSASATDVRGWPDAWACRSRPAAAGSRESGWKAQAPMETLELARWQFAMHNRLPLLLVPISIGLSGFVALMHMYW